MATRDAPRLILGGLSGDAGKTIVSMALLLAFQRRDVQVRAFKKGPDYIDAGWLTWASGHPARNLDTYMMGPERVASSFAVNSIADGVNLIEGNRGLFDGFDTAGTHSTAELARLLQAPVILVLDATKITRTAAAQVLGCQHFDPALRIAGVILNRVNGKRHERILRECIEGTCNVPVLGVVAKNPALSLVPERHLGLVTPEEFAQTGRIEQELTEVAAGLQLDRLHEVANSTSAFSAPDVITGPLPNGRGLKIACVKDSAFSFYYAENIEMLERAGAELVHVSSLGNGTLPSDVDAIYIGGGFPETHAQQLAANQSFMNWLREAALSRLPTYAECGGLMVLSRSLTWRGTRYPMAAVFDFDVHVCDNVQGHGYVQLEVDGPNPFFEKGVVLRGHEFHYSRIVLEDLVHLPFTACAVNRGTGCFKGRDGIVTGNVWASYTHLHALASPEWVTGMINAARQRRACSRAA
ncbi:MAG: cobyrinate a,c-diamide synthase [Terriglobales bacterium]